MSSKNSISPADIVASVMDLPPSGVHHCHSKSAPERIRAAIAGRGPRARHTRVVVYRFDGDGDGRDLCDRVQTGLQSGELPFHDLCRKLNADLQLIELGAGDPAPEDNARAAAFGMMAAEEDTGLLVLAAFGAERKKRIHGGDFMQAVTPDTAALFGAIVSGARAGIPVIVEGLKGLEAARALNAVRPDLCENVFVCGVPSNIHEPDLTVFADDTPDHPAYAAVALATLFMHEQGGDEQAA